MVKLLRMKNLNLVLALALLGLMYKTPSFLLDVANNVIGRAILVISLAFIVIRCDFSCAILFALIIIVLLHNNVEGFKESINKDDLLNSVEETKNEVQENSESEPTDGDAAGDAAGNADGDATGNSDGNAAGNAAGDAAGNAAGGAAGDAAGNAVGDAAGNADGNADDDDDDEEAGEEPFIGGFTKKLNNLRKVLKSNITDLDRELKLGAERRSISATKQ